MRTKTKTKNKNCWTVKMKPVKYKSSANRFLRRSEPRRSKYKFDDLLLIITMNIQ